MGSVQVSNPLKGKIKTCAIILKGRKKTSDFCGKQVAAFKLAYLWERVVFSKRGGGRGWGGNTLAIIFVVHLPKSP